MIHRADHAGDTYLPLYPGLYSQLECYTKLLLKTTGPNVWSLNKNPCHQANYKQFSASSCIKGLYKAAISIKWMFDM